MGADRVLQHIDLYKRASQDELVSYKYRRMYIIRFQLAPARPSSDCSAGVCGRAGGGDAQLPTPLAPDTGCEAVFAEHAHLAGATSGSRMSGVEGGALCRVIARGQSSTTSIALSESGGVAGRAARGSQLSATNWMT